MPPFNVSSVKMSRPFGISVLASAREQVIEKSTLLAVSTVLALGGSALALPDRSFQIIASWAAGGGVDTVTRIFADRPAGLEADRIHWVPSQGGAPALQDLAAGALTALPARRSMRGPCSRRVRFAPSPS
jgi:tripartite-type tricarboxylate transporter receptor subunit TctC